MADRALTLYRAELQKLLGAIRRGELELEAAHSQLATDVIAKLREATKTRRTTAQLEQLFDAEFAKTFPKRVRIVRTNIREGADAGPAVGKRTFRAVLGEDVVDSQVRETAGAMAEAADRIAGRITVDKVGLTKRMRRVDREVSQGMAQEVQRGIKQQRGILGAARKIERIDPRSVELPKYLQELEAAARAGDKGAVRDIAKSYTKRIAQLGEVQTDGTFLASKYSLKSATKKFVQDVQTASSKQLDGVVKRYVKEKLAYQANRIARSETVEAMRQSYVKQMGDKAGVVCFQWTLSNRHASSLHGGSKMDVCDILANQNAYGLGPGRYPAAHVPKLPHPNCCIPGAVVETSTGDMPIENVRPGMLVRTHRGALRPVTRLSARHWSGQLVVATIGERRLVATPEHPVLTTRGWQLAGRLESGDMVVTRAGAEHARPFTLSRVTALEREKYAGPVHNFSVAVDESYVVDGVVVHNCLCTVHAVINRDTFSRSADEGRVPADMQDHDSPDATAWLKQNPGKARAILGPTRHALLEKGVPVLEPTGQIKRVSALVQRSSRKAGAR